MKTEQEQIEDIVKILLESSKKCLDADCNNCDKQYEKDCAQYRKALALVQAGCGDIKQPQIDVLNRVMTYINNKIEAEYGDTSDSVKYLTINIYDFDDFIDELIKEVQNAEDKG